MLWNSMSTVKTTQLVWTRESIDGRGECSTFSVVKPYNPNDDERFPDRAHAKPAPILIDDEKEWEVETILDFRERRGRGPFLVKWKGYLASENSWEPVEGLENAEGLVQPWWTDNMPGAEFPTVFSGYITVC